jgi:hypothetical protein
MLMTGLLTTIIRQMGFNRMRELNVNEIEQVNGGILPLLGYYAYMGLSIYSMYSLAEGADGRNGQ